MTAGPGKYDDLATYVREQAQARGVVVIVIEGDKGSGFSVQTTGTFVIRLPTLLRSIADTLDEDLPRS